MMAECVDAAEVFAASVPSHKNQCSNNKCIQQCYNQQCSSTNKKESSPTNDSSLWTKQCPYGHSQDTTQSVRSQSYDSGLVADMDLCVSCTQQEMDLPTQSRYVGSMPNGMPVAHTLAAARNSRFKASHSRSLSLPSMIGQIKLQNCNSASEELLDVPRTHCGTGQHKAGPYLSSDSGLDSTSSSTANNCSCNCQTGQSDRLSLDNFLTKPLTIDLSPKPSSPVIQKEPGELNAF